MDNIVKKPALLSMSDSKVLVDIAIEKEKTRIMIVERKGKQYFLRFINDMCYSFEDLDNCCNSPVHTCYKAENCQYALVCSDSESKILYTSNSIGYLIRKSKTLLNNFNKEYWVKDLTNNKISATISSKNVRIFLSDETLNSIIGFLNSIVKILDLDESFSNGFIKIAKTASEVVIHSEDRILKDKKCYYDYISIEYLIKYASFSKLDYIKVNLDSILNSKQVKGFYRNSETEDKVVLVIG